MSQDIFHKGLKAKLRFGHFSIEDLWDLPLQSSGRPSLQSIAQGLSQEIKNTEEDFIGGSTKSNATAELSLEIVKQVIADKIAVRDAKALRAKNKRQRDLVASIISEKQDGELRGKSLDELNQLMFELSE